MSETKLLPCPFCGGEAELVYFDDKGHLTFIDNEEELEKDCAFVHCCNCHMDFMPDSSIAREVLNMWNTRKPMEKIVERLEREKRFYDSASDIDQNIRQGVINAIEIIKEEGNL